MSRTAAAGYGAAAAGVARAIRGRRRVTVKRRPKARPATAKRPRTGSRTGTRRVKQKMSSSAGGVQWTRSKLRTGRKKPLMARLKQNLGTSTQPLVYRLRKVKNFDNHGALPMDKYQTPEQVFYPWYVMSLNSCNRVNAQTNPVRQLSQFKTGTNEGRMQWNAVAHMNASGSPLTTQYDVLKGFREGFSNHVENALWQHSNIKMNLWGAKNKPVRYTVEILTVTDHKLSPFNLSAGSMLGTEPQQELESMMKQYYFNPISVINWGGSKHIKVLKRFDIVIQPVESTDGDQDPKCHQLTWDTTWDRVVNYKDVMAAFSDGGAAPFVVLNRDEAINTVSEANENLASLSCHPSGTGIVFLSVRASEFSEPVLPGFAPIPFNNSIHGSIDFDIKNYFRTDGAMP